MSAFPKEELNANELEVLGILWAEAPLKPQQIEEAFSWPIENATLRSVLRDPSMDLFR